MTHTVYCEDIEVEDRRAVSHCAKITREFFKNGENHGENTAFNIHCESEKKLDHFYFYCNFCKCWLIFKILSMSELERNGS